MLGQAIGDAMGSQTEFRKGRDVNDLGPTWSYSFPAFSDDTQMAIAIAEGLLETLPNPNPKHSEPFYHDAAMQAVARNFVAWDNGKWGSNNRSPGGCCMSGVHRIRCLGAERWFETGSLSGKGNGGAMRSSFVGCYFASNPLRAFQFGALSSVPTHNNLESLLASGAIAFLVAMSVNGQSLGLSMHSLMEVLGDWENVLISIPSSANRTEASFAISRLGSAYAAAKHLTVSEFKQMNGNDGKGIEAVAAAIHANAKFSNYGQIITELANKTGDSDSTAAIGGALAGARFGYGFIRGSWRNRIETSKYLHDLAERLYQGSIGQLNLPTADTTEELSRT